MVSIPAEIGLVPPPHPPSPHHHTRLYGKNHENMKKTDEELGWKGEGTHIHANNNGNKEEEGRVHG